MKNNTREINDLKFQNKLLKERLDYKEKSLKLKIKENNVLRNEIEKLKEIKIQKSNIIDDLEKSDKAWSTFPKILQDVRKREDKARTFAPTDNNDKSDEINDLAEEALALSILTKLKKPNDLKNTVDEYKDINLNRVDDLINEIGYNDTIDNNIVDLSDNESIYFKDLLDIYMILKIIRLINLIKQEFIMIELKRLKTSS